MTHTGASAADVVAGDRDDHAAPTQVADEPRRSARPRRPGRHGCAAWSGSTPRRGDLGTGHEPTDYRREPAIGVGAQPASRDGRREDEHAPAAAVLEAPAVRHRQPGRVALAQVVAVGVALGGEIVEPDDARPYWYESVDVAAPRTPVREHCRFMAAKLRGRSDAAWWMPRPAAMPVDRPPIQRGRSMCAHEQPASAASPAAARPLGWPWPAERSTASRARRTTPARQRLAALDHPRALRRAVLSFALPPCLAARRAPSKTAVQHVLAAGQRRPGQERHRQQLDQQHHRRARRTARSSPPPRPNSFPDADQSAGAARARASTSSSRRRAPTGCSAGPSLLLPVLLIIGFFVWMQRRAAGPDGQRHVDRAQPGQGLHAPTSRRPRSPTSPATRASSRRSPRSSTSCACPSGSGDRRPRAEGHAARRPARHRQDAVRPRRRR